MQATSGPVGPLLRWGGAGLLLAALAGCGGGVYVDIPPDDRPPVVALNGGPSPARITDILRFTADADDDYAVRQVTLYQVNPNGRDFFIDVDPTWPYTFNVEVPDNTPIGSVLAFYAVAEDDVGQTRSSNLVEIRVP